MQIESPKPVDVLNTLTIALTQLRQLAALPDADPFYPRAAEQVAAIVTELQSRTPPTANVLPDHADPNVRAEPDPNQPEPPDPG